MQVDLRYVSSGVQKFHLFAFREPEGNYITSKRNIPQSLPSSGVLVRPKTRRYESRNETAIFYFFLQLRLLQYLISPLLDL